MTAPSAASTEAASTAAAPAEPFEPGAPVVSPTDAAARLERGATLIDVRSEKGRSENGAIPSAIVADRTALDAQFLLDSPVKFAEIVDLDQEIVVVCGSLNGSDPVARGLLERGFTNVVQVDGGYPAWKDAGLPTLPPTA